MKTMDLSNVLARAGAAIFSLSIIGSTYGGELSKLPFLKVGTRYLIHYTENTGLPERVTILESTGGDWYRCAAAPILPEGDSRTLQGHPNLAENEPLWINFSHVVGVAEIGEGGPLVVSELEKAVADQSAKVEEGKKILAAIMKAKGIVDSGPSAADSNDANSPDSESVRKRRDAQDYVDAKRDLETDQALLDVMKHELISQQKQKSDGVDAR